jgi:hypothetical protein
VDDFRWVSSDPGVHIRDGEGPERPGGAIPQGDPAPRQFLDEQGASCRERKSGLPGPSAEVRGHRLRGGHSQRGSDPVFDFPDWETVYRV